MRIFGGRRNQAEEFAEAIRPELEQLPVPSPRNELLDRITASRASGMRVILPDVTDRSAISTRRFVIPSVIVAALLLVLLPLRRVEPPAPSAGEVSSLSRIAGEWMPGSVAFAQSYASRTQGKSPPMTFARPQNIRPVRLQYLRTWTNASRREIGRMTGIIAIGPGESASWLVVSSNEGSLKGQRFFTLDTVAVARNDLRILRHTAVERPYSRYDEIRIEQIFRGDSVVGSMHAHGARVPSAARSISRELSRANRPYILDAMAPIILGTVNLHRGWSGSASILGWTVRNDDVFQPIDLRVDGDQTITVPAGRFECWRLRIQFGSHSITSWSRKSDGVGVRSVETDPAGVTREVVLRAER
jgi:hypothetical protein